MINPITHAARHAGPAKWTLAGGLAVALGTLFMACTASPERVESKTYKHYGLGEIVLADAGTAAHLLPMRQSVRRDRDGRMIVRVEWANISDADRTARLRMVFYTESGHAEDKPEDWEVETFPPGSVTIMEWKSFSGRAAAYGLEVRSVPAEGGDREFNG